MGIVKPNPFLISDIVGKLGESRFRHINSSTNSPIDLYTARATPPVVKRRQEDFKTPQLQLRICDDLWKMADEPWRDKWRSALKRRVMNGYSLWMKEALYCAYKGTYLPDQPSPSGGFSTREVMPGESLPNPKHSCPYTPAPWWPGDKPSASWWIDERLNKHGDVGSVGWHNYYGFKMTTKGICLRHTTTSASGYIYAYLPLLSSPYWLQLQVRGSIVLPSWSTSITISAGSATATVQGSTGYANIVTGSGSHVTGGSGTMIFNLAASGPTAPNSDYNPRTWCLYGWPIP